MKKTAVVLVAGSAVAIAFAAGIFTTVIAGSQRIERAVAVRWDDTQSKVVQAQAHVYLEPRLHKKEVKLAVHFGRELRWVYGPRTLGWAQTTEEAVARWGQIEWRVDGLYVGTGTNQFFLKRDQLPPQ